MSGTRKAEADPKESLLFRLTLDDMYDRLDRNNSSDQNQGKIDFPKEMEEEIEYLENFIGTLKE